MLDQKPGIFLYLLSHWYLNKKAQVYACAFCGERDSPKGIPTEELSVAACLAKGGLVSPFVGGFTRYDGFVPIKVIGIGSSYSQKIF